jgi:hypothetical protein
VRANIETRFSAAVNPMSHESVDCPCWDEALPIRVGAVVRTWSTIVARTHPWDGMQLDDVAGKLRSIASAIVNAECDDEDARSHRIASSAYEHGLFRRAQRFPRRLLAAELSALREAIRADLTTGEWSEALVDQAMDGLIGDIRLARRRALSAFDAANGERREDIAASFADSADPRG